MNRIRRSRRLRLESLEARRLLATLVVNSNDDVVDNAGCTQHCSLREAIEAANDSPDASTITFSLAQGSRTIRPNSALPPIVHPLTLDASAMRTSNGRPGVILDGQNVPNGSNDPSGLRLRASGSVVRGLSIVRFPGRGIAIYGADDVVLVGNFVGVHPEGDVLGNGSYGIIAVNAADSTIGGSEPHQRNLISGNSFAGVFFTGNETRGNHVVNNMIGTSADGLNPAGNGGWGLILNSGAHQNRIGGNTISGNQRGGVLMLGAGTNENTIIGNKIGVGDDGFEEMGNQGAGVFVSGDRLNTVGPASNEILLNNISFNGQQGILIASGAANNTIGSSDADLGNAIMGNRSSGIQLEGYGTNDNAILNNLIGVTRNGSSIGNHGSGIIIGPGPSRTAIGKPGVGNTISANRDRGILIFGAGAKENKIQGNRIGLHADGVTAAPNLAQGILLSGARLDSLQETLVFAVDRSSGSSVPHGQFPTGDVNNDGNVGDSLDVQLESLIELTQRIVELGLGSSIRIGVTAYSNTAEEWDLDPVAAGTQITTFAGADRNQNGTLDVVEALRSITPFADVLFGPAFTAIRNTLLQSGTPAHQRNVLFLNAGTNHDNEFQDELDALVATGAQIIAVGAGTDVNQNQLRRLDPRMRFESDGDGLDSAALAVIGLPRLPLGVPAPDVVNLQNNTLIGGSTPGAANIIAHNRGAGIHVVDPFTNGNTISRNSIFANDGIGINLGVDGVTANDLGDNDIGGNGLLNFPDPSSSVKRGPLLTVGGNYNGKPNETFLIEAFGDFLADPLGRRDASVFLGEFTLTTNANGWANFTETMNVGGVSPNTLSLTATDSRGNTSELSYALEVQTNVLPFLVLTPIVAAVDEDGNESLQYEIVRYGGSTADSLLVRLDIAGTATHPGDYQRIGFQADSLDVLIPSGQDRVRFSLDPTPDNIFEPDETVTLGFASSTDYEFSTGNTLISTIRNDDTADNQAPTATLNAGTLTTGGSSTHAITVTYADNVAVDVSDFNNINLTVTDPSGSQGNPPFVSVNVNSDGTPRVATYHVNAPGGSWGPEDNGTYTVSMLTDRVSDTNNNFVASGALGTFTVSIGAPEVTVKGNNQTIDDGDTSPSIADHTDFGSVNQGDDGISRTFTVINDGDAVLTTANLVPPSGFIVTEGLSPNIAAGESDTFTVQLNSGVVGTRMGEIRFDTNDSDENQFGFKITGVIRDPNRPTQNVYGANNGAPAGQTVAVGVQYNTSGNDNTLSGLGLRMHFDSSRLQFEGLNGVLANDLIQQNDPVNDLSDFDNDPDTDQFILVAWADFAPPQEWPNLPIPLELFNANFSIAEELAEGETSRINFTSSSVDATHDFNGTSIIVSVDPAVGLDVDDNGTVDALTDGVLILRHLFGFSGQTLTDGALSISPAANRDNPSDITNYLSGSHSTMLDVDGNGEADALTDGILILRYMFGFSGPQLVAGALGINPQATRTEPADVIAFLDGYRTRSNQQTIESQSLGRVPIQPLSANLESFSQKVAPSLSAAPLQSANATDTRPSQIVAGVNPIVGGEAGEFVTVAVQYETSDNNNLLSGLGVRMHFDSSQLQYRGVVDVLVNDLIQRNDPFSDAADFDNDPSTDQFVLIAWADFAPPQEWPNQPLPVGLFDAEFTIASELPIGTRSNINFTASSTSPTHSFQTTPVEVIVEEEARLSIAPATINMLEGDTGLSEFTFTVTRSGSTRGTATAEYTVTGTGEQPADANDFGGNLPTGTVTFNDGDIKETITVLVSGDVDVEGIESFTVTLINPVSATLQTATAEAIILNDDTTVSINLAPMSVIEDGSDKLVYELTRAGQTDEALTVHFTVNGSASLARDYTGIDENDLTVNFDAGASTAVITIEPVADTDIEADETVVVSMVANADYTISGSAVATGTITNDDVPPTVIVSVSPTSVSEDGDGELDYTFTRVGNDSEALTLTYTVGGTAAAGTHFDALTGTVTIDAGADTAIVTVDPYDNDTIDGDKTLSLTLTGGANYDLGTIITAVGTIVDNDEAGFAVSRTAFTVSESGTSETFTIVLTAEPVTNVVLDVAAADVTEVSVDQATLTFTPANWNVPQTVTVTGVDDLIDDGDQTTIVSVSVDGSASDSVFGSLEDRNISGATTDDDTAGFNVSPTIVTVSESGTSETFTVVLTAEPVTNVVLDVVAADSTEVSVDQATLTFTPADWNVLQTVTVTGVDDLIDDGDQTTTVSVSVNESASDSAFGSIADQNINVTTTNDDTAGFDVSSTVVTVSESGTSETFTVVLTAEPVTDVVLDIVAADSNEVSVDQATLTFTPANWNVAQTITVTGVDDAIDDGDQSTPVSVSVNDSLSDTVFGTLADRTINVTTTNDDTAGFAVSPTAVTVSESGTSETFTVVLTAEPVSDVVLDVVAADSTEVRVDQATLTFTPANWNVAQTVTVTGVDDAIDDGDLTTLVSVSVDAGLSDGVFGAIPARTVDVTTMDDEVFPTVNVSVSPGSVDEDGDGRLVYTLTRVGNTSEALNLTYTVGGTAVAGTDFEALTGTVTIEAGELTATVVVDPTDNDLIEGDRTLALTLDDGANYDLGTTVTVSGTIVDNDVFPSVSVSVSPVSVAEDGSGALVYTFTRTGNTSQVLNLTYVVGGTAVAGTDFEALTGTVTIEAGELTATVVVDPTDNVLIEGNRTLQLTLVDGSNYDLGETASATGTITNDDIIPTVNVSVSPASVSEDGNGVLVYTFRRTGNASEALNLTYTVGGTAVAETDFGALTGSVTIAAGMTTATVSVDPTDNDRIDGDRTLVLTLLDGGNYDSGLSALAIGTIQDNDMSPTRLISSRLIALPHVVAGDGIATAILFRTLSDTVIGVQELGSMSLEERYFLLDEDFERLGGYENGRFRASLVAGRTYALVARPDTVIREFSITSSAGFDALAGVVSRNMLQPTDVSGDGATTALDALKIINALNAADGQGELATTEVDFGYTDVNDDGSVTALDALLVINYLNKGSQSGEPILSERVGVASDSPQQVASVSALTAQEFRWRDYFELAVDVPEPATAKQRDPGVVFEEAGARTIRWQDTESTDVDPAFSSELETYEAAADDWFAQLGG